jgi:hypothetical protein
MEQTIGSRIKEGTIELFTYKNWSITLQGIELIVKWYICKVLTINTYQFY